MSQVKVKICGLKRAEDICFANEVKPDYVGFVFAPQSRRVISQETAQKLRASLHADIVPVGVFVNAPVDAVARLLNEGVIAVAQLHGQEDEAYLAALRARTDGQIWQAFRIGKRKDFDPALHSTADLILLDNGAGGTGRTFDWSLVGDMPRPFFLAGGLTPENVGEAVATIRPYGVDTSSGVETEEKKSLEKMKRFVQAVRANTR